jgi:hypothetical protein
MLMLEPGNGPNSNSALNETRFFSANESGVLALDVIVPAVNDAALDDRVSFGDMAHPAENDDALDDRVFSGSDGNGDDEKDDDDAFGDRGSLDDVDGVVDVVASVVAVDVETGLLLILERGKGPNSKSALNEARFFSGENSKRNLGLVGDLTIEDGAAENEAAFAERSSFLSGVGSAAAPMEKEAALDDRVDAFLGDD